MRLTKNTYFTLQNKYLSSSKIKDFIKDPNYFYRRHVTGEIKFIPTPSMRIGSAVDLWLTGSKAQFNKAYCLKILKKDNPELYQYQQECGAELLAQGEWDKVNGICNAVRRTDIYKDIKKRFKSQKILQFPMKIGKFKGLCGVEDWYCISEDGTKCIIIDLKTTKSIDERQFLYSCYDYSYFRQQAMYQTLFKLIYPEIKKFTSYILAVENTGPHYQSNIFKLNQMEIDAEKITIWKTVKDLRGMTKAKDFKPYNLTWDNVIEL